MISFRKGNIRLALHSIGSSKGRSFLTMLGVIIGVASVICVVCIGVGVRNQVENESAKYGKDVLVVRPKGNSLARAGGLTAVNVPLTNKTLDTVRSTQHVAKAVPLATVVGAAKGDHEVDNPLVIATTADFAEIRNHPIRQGGFLDSEPGSKTVVLGPKISEQLFDDTVPLGQKLSFRGETFMVVGLYEPFPASPFSIEANYNEAIFMPYSTASALPEASPVIHQVLAKVDSPDAVSVVSKRISEEITRQHGGARDTEVTSVKDNASGSEETMKLILTMTIGIALIVFLVGGIGIMNVMLVSVAERTQEVGLRKAVGASNRQILNQFLAEAYVLSAIGAFVGVLAALLAMALFNLFTNLRPAFVWQAFVLAPIIAVITGVVFGTFPAVKAARKDPIDSLRQR